MKKTILLLIFAFTLYNCQNKTTPDTETVGQHIEIANLDQYERFGEIFNVTEVLTTKEMQQRLTNLKVGDTLDVIFEGNVKEVCQKKVVG